MGLRDTLSTVASSVNETIGRDEQLTEDEMTKMGDLAQEIQSQEKHEEHVVKLREESLELAQRVSKEFQELEKDEEKVEKWNKMFLNGNMPAKTWFKNVEGEVGEMLNLAESIESDMQKLHSDIVEADDEERKAAQEDEQIEEFESAVEEEFNKFEEITEKLRTMMEDAEEEVGMGLRGQEDKTLDELS